MESQRNTANHRRGVRPSVGYLLFQYQSELTRRHAEPTRLSRTKIHIIDGLVSRTIRHMRNCSMEDLKACKRELVYKEQLRDQLKNMRRKRSSSANNTKISANTSDKAAPVVSVKAPSTPPKPRSLSRSETVKMDIFGPEIFV
ncbi:uncharacterized protein LOC108107795 [Drosophila eugracilis]|uniref:uncharacterized protein LOC108107795 n=1 Tax=Drosophila eugracilis TaxID=29029 RepID=UPI0007E8A563|nr:uncharacterized protein LOC108107795 [Drosophila eugracilis]XP_017071000.1 uncharacterized protein LOC108107795 [Drosophila eugracilis]